MNTTKKSTTTTQFRTPEEEYEDLQKRFNLLVGDRNAYYETSIWTMRQNRDTITLLQKENKELKGQLQALTRNATNAMSGTANSWNAGGGETAEEAQFRRKYDESKNRVIKRKKELLGLKDKLKLLSQEQSKRDDEPQMRKIRMLENRLDKATIKYNEAQSIRRTYEQIVKRLKEERIGYDNQLAAIERSLKGKEHDFEELLLLSHDANHAKEIAEAELKRFEVQVIAERVIRDEEVNKKKAAVLSRLEMTKKMERREKDKMNALLGDKSSEQAAIEKAVSSTTQEFLQDGQLEKQKAEIQKCELAFRRIKEATGVSDVNEVIQKFSTQEDTLNNLQELKAENQAKLEQLTQLRQELKQEVDALKYAAGENMSRKQVDEVENNVNFAQNKAERNKFKLERVEKILIDVKAGIEHLSERIENIKVDGQPNIPVTDDTMLEVLMQSEQKISKVSGDVKEEFCHCLQDDNPELTEDEARQHQVDLLWLRSKLTGVKEVPTTAGGDIQTVNNVRVRIPDKDEDELSDGDLDDEETELANRKKMKLDAQRKYENTTKGKSKSKKFKTQTFALKKGKKQYMQEEMIKKSKYPF